MDGEARAFCAWLTERWRQQDRLPPGHRVELPSEPEWEKAARGGLRIPRRPVIAQLGETPVVGDLIVNPDPRRRYPWGKEPDANRAHYDKSWNDEPCALGCFPTGASPYGCRDLSGNVWEWTRSLWGTGDKPDFPYPYDPGDGRETLDEPDKVRRVLRGGSFFLNPRSCRCAWRGDREPDSRYDHIGFRVVVSPFL